MRILIPNIVYQDNFEDNVSYTLRKMGHEVITMPRPVRILNEKYRHILKLITDRITPNAYTLQEKWILDTLKNFKPDIVLCLTQALNEEVLSELRKRKIITICWWGDTAANMTKQGLLCEGWDFIYIKDKFAVQKLRSLKLNAQFLLEAMNPAWHNKFRTERSNAIVVAGNAYEYRHLLLRKLLAEKKYNIQLYGNRPPRWAHNSVANVYMNKYVVREEKSKIFGNGAACLNSTSMTEFDSMNCRAFEIAGAGGLQILEYRTAVEECFEPEKEIYTFKSLEELNILLDLSLKYPNEVMEVRENGYKRAHADHTYEHRLKLILKNLN